jgi:hypothetical protein
MKKLLMALAVTVFNAVPGYSTVLIADPTMAAANYSGYVPNGAFGNLLNVGGFSLTVGGNPGAFRSAYISTPNGLSAAQALGEFNILNAWNPKSMGAINTVSFSIDHYTQTQFAGGAPTVLTSQPQMLFGVRQNNMNYYNFAYFPTSTNWETVQSIGRTQTSFITLSGGANPDFSTNGGPVEFGYFASIYEIGAKNFAVNVDNFCVAVNDDLRGCSGAFTSGVVPEPATYALIGSALLGVSLLRVRRR